MKIRIIVIIFLALNFSCNSNKRNLKKQQALAIKNATTTYDTVNWSGIYRGVFPCADCEGIQIELSISKKGTYEITKRYEGKSEDILSEKGNFRWLPDGNAITLYSGNNSNEYTHFLVAENKLIKLDKDAKKIESEFSELYVLKKKGYDDRITEKYWRLIEMNGKAVEKQPGREQLHFRLKLIDSGVFGFAGCNRFSGHFELMQGNRIQFTKMMRTLIACKQLETENQFLKQLEEVNTYQVKNDTLSLQKVKSKESARFVFEGMKSERPLDR